MTREIEFRGKVANDVHCEDGEIVLKGTWVYGSLITNNGKPYIVGEIIDHDIDCIVFEFWYQVDPKTVGHYTGLKDKNGKKIYDGDVIDGGMLRCNDGYSIHVSSVTVTFESGMFKAGSVSLCSFNNTSKVIGNIHEVTNNVD